MLRNYFNIALRNLRKNRGTSLINLLGLSIGLASCLLIFMYIRYESSFDQFHHKSDRIFRIITIDEALGVTSNHVSITLPPLAEEMKQQIPEVIDAFRMTGFGSQIAIENQRYNLDNLWLAEPGFFRMLDFGWIQGDKNVALDEPNTAVITEEIAQRVFGKTDVVGELMEINGHSIKLTGVIANPPPNSHIDYDLLVSMFPTEADSNRMQMLQSWGRISMRGYVELADANQQATVEEKMETLIRSHDVGENFRVILQPMNEVHLHSDNIIFDGPNTHKSSITYIYTLWIVSIFLLLIAAFNYMNLSTARSAYRAREVGLRKVVGAGRYQLIVQFMIEAITLCGLALFLALGCVALIGEWISLSIPENPVIFLFKDIPLLLAVIGGTLLIGVLSGSYPAFMLSSFRPVEVLKGAFARSGKGLWLRRSLVVLQFTASTAMIIGTVIVSQQLKLIRQMDKGFNPEQVITLTLNHSELRENYEQLKNELSKVSAIKSIAASSSMPGQGFGRNGIQPEGAAEDDIWIVSVMSIDENYIPLMGMEMAQGRNFDPSFTTDSVGSVLINESLAKELGWSENAVGKQIEAGPQRMKVAGVVKDFHFSQLRHKIEPLLMYYQPNSNYSFAMKVDAQNLNQTLDGVEKTWNQVNPGHPFAYQFFDEEFGQQFESEEEFARLVVIFTWLAIFIACLGLLGLSSFAAEQRTKEIGIRKVVGASTTHLIYLLTKELALLVGISAVLAIPIAALAMQNWLSNYAYRIELPIWVFVMAALLALGIAILTNAYHAIKTARKNPVKALRYE